MKGSCQAFQDKEGLTEGLYPRPVTAFTPNFDNKIKSVRFAAEPPRLPLRRELSSLLVFKGLTEGEITRGSCLHQGVDEHGAKKRSFAFTLVYIKCFRTYSVYLSFRHGVLILRTPCHLPPQREARALPRQRTQSPPTAFIFPNTPSASKVCSSRRPCGCVRSRGLRKRRSR